MRVTKRTETVDGELESAQEAALMLLGDGIERKIPNIFCSDDLSAMEGKIKALNEFSSKGWIISALLIHTLVYNTELYRQSGLTWAEYSRQSRDRLGMDGRDITEALSASRFFIKHHKALEGAGFSLCGARRKLARAELALRLSDNLPDTIEHVAHDTWSEFKQWYTSFRHRALPHPKDNTLMLNGIKAVTISDSLPVELQEQLKRYIQKAINAISEGHKIKID